MAAVPSPARDRRRPGVRHQRLRGRQRDDPGGEGRVRVHGEEAVRPDARPQFNSEVHTPVLYQNHLFAVGQQDARAVHVPRPRRQGRLAEPGRVGRPGRGAHVRARRLPAGGRHVLRARREVGDAAADRGRARRGTRSWRARRSCPARTSGGRSPSSDGKLVLRDMSQMVCLQVGPARRGQVGHGLERRSRGSARPAPPRASRAAVAADPAGRERRRRVRRRRGGRAAPRRPRRRSGPRGRRGLRRCRAAELPPLPHRYARAAVVVGPGLPGEFRRSLSGLALGPRDAVYALGDDEVRVFEAAGRLARRWAAPEKAPASASAADGRVAVGSPGRVDLYAATGGARRRLRGGRRRAKPADVTAIRLLPRRRARGRRRGPGHPPLRPAGSRAGRDRRAEQDRRLHAAEPEPRLRRRRRGRRPRHRHAAATGSRRGRSTGRRVASFGKFGMAKPEDFVGCCNPVNVAVTPDGKVVTAEKMVARVKVFGQDGTLLARHRPRALRPDVPAHPRRGRLLRADRRGAIPCAGRSRSSNGS